MLVPVRINQKLYCLPHPPGKTCVLLQRLSEDGPEEGGGAGEEAADWSGRDQPQGGDRGGAERRQVHVLQRTHQEPGCRRELPLLHHRSQ